MLLLEYGPPPSWNSSIHNSAWTAEILCIAVSWEIPQHHLRWSGFTNSSTTCDVIIVDGFGPNAVYTHINETMKYTVSKKQLPAWNTLSQRNSCLREIHRLKETAACMIYTVSKKQLPAWKKAELCCCNPLLHVCRSAIYLDLHDTQLNSAQLPSTLWLAATVCSTSSHYSPKLCTHAWLITTLQHSTIVVVPNQCYHTVAL